MIGPAIPCRAVPHGLGVAQLGSSRGFLVSQMHRDASHFDEGPALCLSCETAINGSPVRSVMDQHCSFPRFPTSARPQEGWQSARRSIVLLSQPFSRGLTSIHKRHCESRGITDSQLCHDAGLGPPANAQPARQRTNDRDLSLTRVSVGRMVLAHSYRGLVGWLSLTVSTNLWIHGRVITAWAVAMMVLRGSGESYTQLFGLSIHTSRYGKPLGGPVLEAWLRCFPTC